MPIELTLVSAEWSQKSVDVARHQSVAGSGIEVNLAALG